MARFHSSSSVRVAMLSKPRSMHDHVLLVHPVLFAEALEREVDAVSRVHQA